MVLSNHTSGIISICNGASRKLLGIGHFFRIERGDSFGQDFGKN
ncbi:Uncharacterised protein [Salmonella enterica subsp. enterica]|uniref:Uncharacterized protein n=1 Tax=Salmonella enterica I TaxID=59201 RepID=A0A447N5I1_SALET|nr:Uncharacterised protein [Salmonella enterica subsp. enterica]